MSVPPTVTAAIEAAHKSATPDGSRAAAELIEIDQEISKLARAIDNLVEQREALLQYRARIVERTRGRGHAQARSHRALYAALEAQAAAIHERGAAWTQPDRLALEPPFDPAMASLFNDLQTSIPSSGPVDDAADERHDQVRKRLVSMLHERTAPTPFEGPEIEVDVVWSVDAPEGTAELLVVLLPVRALVDAPTATGDDLPTWLAARVGQALFGAVRAVGFDDADVRTGPALGYDLLDIEVDLSSAPEELVPELVRRLTDRLTDAPELRAARVVAKVTEIDASIVFPEEVDDD